MFKINDNYLKLPGSYLFSTIAQKVAAYTEAHSEADIIRLGIGDVTQPIAPAIIEAVHKAADEMGTPEGFHGYAPDLGYEFLRSKIAKEDFQARGCDISADEIFVSDGAKCDCGNIQSAIRCIRFMWIPMSWRAEVASMMLPQSAFPTLSTCPVQRKTILLRSFRQRLRI